MVRNYKKKGGTTRLRYSQDDVAAALVSINEGESVSSASRRTGIPKSTLLKRYKGKVARAGQSGSHTALMAGEEVALAQNVATLGDFGYAFDLTTLRQFVHFHLNSMQRVVPQFKNNYPGVDWAYGFLKCHENILTQRTCQDTSDKKYDEAIKCYRNVLKEVKLVIFTFFFTFIHSKSCPICPLCGYLGPIVGGGHFCPIAMLHKF